MRCGCFVAISFGLDGDNKDRRTKEQKNKDRGLGFAAWLVQEQNNGFR